MKKEIKKKNYTVRLWYTWYKDIDVVAETPQEAYDLACAKPWEEITEDFDVDDLEYDNHEVFGGAE